MARVMRKTLECTVCTPVSTRIVLGPLDRLGSDLAQLGSARRVLVVTDSTVGPLYAETVVESLSHAGLQCELTTVPAGEASKSLHTAAALFGQLADLPLGRDGLVVGLGGGVVTDLAGFIAATWMRGVHSVLIPTTIEGAIDASIGGKTAINLSAGKNLVGAFHHPSLIAIDPTTFSTLSPRDVRAGMAESIKHALISSESFVRWHEDHHEAVLLLEDRAVAELVSRNIDVKFGVVRRDPEERSGERMVLNYGHTIGHAIERGCDYALRHGECVGLGMLAAVRISAAMRMHDAGLELRVTHLLERFGLPTSLAVNLPFDAVLDAIVRDKKNRSGTIRFVLLSGIGRAVVRDDVPEELVREAFHSLRS